jgi:hypothetical protein
VWPIRKPFLIRFEEVVQMDTVLYHHGIKGQKWGIRRYQNPDGTWTDAGKARYGDSTGESDSASGKTSSGTRKKVAIGVATGAAIVAGTVLTAYLVKKYGAKNISDIGNTASAGKEILQDILKTTPVSTTPVSQIPAPKVDPKQVLEKAIKSTPITSTPVSQVSTPKAGPKQVLETAAKSISTTSAPASQISAPRVSVSKPSSSVPPPYSFDSLIRQNDDLLKKMLAELA